MHSCKSGLFMLRKTLALALYLISSHLVFAACSADLATYAPISKSGFSLRFDKVKEPKAWSELGLTLSTPTRSSAYEFTASNGYETFYLVPLDAKPLAGEDPAIYFFDDTMKTLPLPQTGDAAPAYIFTPTLGGQLWYAGLEPRELLPTEIWKLSGCME
jgi:hypothetical protein